MAKEKILLVEDAEDILELIRYNLVKEGFQVSCAVSGEEALNAIRQTAFDLILLDLMLPGLDGLEVCRRLRRDAATAHIPVIMLTAKSEETDMVVGLELGADDYVTKPFSPRVLTARIRAALRRSRQTDEDAQAEICNFGALRIDRSRHEVSVHDEAVRGEGWSVTDRAVDVQIVGLRKKLGGLGSCIETVRGVGYRFRAQEET